MALYDRVKVVTGTTGNSVTITLGAAEPGYRAFSGVVPSGVPVSYLIEDGTAWEIGTGTFTGTSSFNRTTLLASSTGARLALTATAKVMVTALSQDLMKDFIVALGDETTAITAGNGKVSIRMPYPFYVTQVRLSLVTAQSTGNLFVVDVRADGTSIFGASGNRPSIANGLKSSFASGTAYTISNPLIADDAELLFDVAQIGDGTAKGLKVALLGYRA